KLPLAEIFKNSSIRTLSETIEKFTRETYVTIEPVENKEYYSLSSAQKRLYVLQQMELESTAYNMPQTIPLDNDTDPVKLKDVFKKLIRRHEILRTSFYLKNNPVTPGGGPVTPEEGPVTLGEVLPVQVIHETVEFEIEYYNLEVEQDTTEDEMRKIDDVRKAFFRPFVLSKAPLLRVGVIKIAEKSKTIHRGMLVDMHHIITDAVSHEVLTKEFLAQVAGDALPPLILRYRDYAEWQNGRKQKELTKLQEEYWIKLFSGELPLLSLPTDYPRPVIQRFEGNNISF
ncbi:MAG: hypothetical protein GY757_10260, partial [bacterium]|nr:hypothetical protein [bacterium]